MGINVIVAKKLREEHYDIFLYYLNNMSVKHDVHLYTTSCKDNIDYPQEYFQHLDNIKVTHTLLPSEDFNKSKLLNHSLEIMREIDKSGFVCVFDIDMIYCSDFFKKIKDSFLKGNNYIVSYGQKFTEEQTENISKHLDKVENIFRVGGERFRGCSQISFTIDVFRLFKKYFGSFYDEHYVGWGGEDSDLSFKSHGLNARGIIKKDIIRDVWAHMWHPDNKPKNHKDTENFKYFENNKERVNKIIGKIS